MSAPPDLPELVVRALRMSLERGYVQASRTETGRLLATLGLVQTMQGDRSAATEVLDEAIRLASLRGDEATIAFATQTKGLKQYLAGDFASAEPLFMDALGRYEKFWRDKLGRLRQLVERETD